MKEFQTFIDIEYLSNSQKILTQFQCFSSGLKADREVLLSYYHYYIKKHSDIAASVIKHAINIQMLV